MVIQRRPPPHPRRGPSCLVVLLVVAAFSLGVFVVGNAQEVRDVIVPTATPEPTRSAAEYATSAALYERDGEFENAVEAYQKAIALDKTNIKYYLELIDLLITINRAHEALEQAKQVQELAPEQPEVWVALASAHLSSGYRLDETGDPDGALLEYQETINAASRAAEINPNLAEAHAYTAQALLQLGPEQWDAALESATLGVELAPDSPVTREAMALVYEQRGLYDNAIEEYLTALEHNANLVDLRTDLAYLYFFTGRQQQALATLQEVIEMAPDNAAAYDGLAYFYFILGQYPSAEENAFKAVQLDPEMTRAHAHLGGAYFKQFKYDTAIEELEIAVSSYEEVSTATAPYFNMLGLAYQRQDRCEQAVPYFERVLTAAPDEFAVAEAEAGMELCRQQDR